MIKETVNIVGLGGIGSYIAEEAARIGCSRLNLFDDDRVEPHNLGNQRYSGLNQVGLFKAEVMTEKLVGLADWHAGRGIEIEIIAKCERVGAESELLGIVIVAVDSIEARKEIFSVCRLNPAIPLYIEAGAAENEGVVHVFVPHDPDHVRAYEWLLSALSGHGPNPCVRRGMGGQFASIVSDWLIKFGEGKLPPTLISSYIHYRNLPQVVSEPTISYP